MLLERRLVHRAGELIAVLVALIGDELDVLRTEPVRKPANAPQSIGFLFAVPWVSFGGTNSL
jgi:hypothetical protein